VIHLRNIGISFKERKLLEHVNLHVPACTSLSIIGPSGSGKSVLLKIIAGLIQPTEGECVVNSQKVSMLFQKNALFDSFTLIENLLTPLAETVGIHGEEAQDRSMKMLKAVGLDHAANLYPDEISGGMQKRLGIARALIIEPEVILYDEPTAGLDPITSRSIADLMIELQAINKTTMVVVTNDLQRAYQVSDQIAFCSNHTIQAMGTPTQVKNTNDPQLRNFIYSNALGSNPAGAAR
jgi:phospholipid/cholesterol/gamma-HCH transport system ATP-binding protein